MGLLDKLSAGNELGSVLDMAKKEFDGLEKSGKLPDDMKELAVKKIVATIKRRKMVVVGFRLSKTCVDQMNDNPQIIMATTPAICVKKVFSFMAQRY